MTQVVPFKHEEITTDILVIGAGAAGIRAAIEAKRNGVDVLVISKMPQNLPSSTYVAIGWITYVEEKAEDEVFKSVVEEGCYLNNQSLVGAFVDGSKSKIPELRQLGVKLKIQDNPWSESWPRFNRQTKLYLCIPAKKHLFIPSKKPAGTALIEPLTALAENLGVKILHNLVVTRLLTNNGSIVGAVVVNLNSGSLLSLKAKAVILATGGGAQIYGRTNNPLGTTGDGYAIAYKAGAELVDMEFMDFVIPNITLRRIFETELSKEIVERILSQGLCHYFLGGVKVDDNMTSSVKGLYVAGEVSGGLFGASRLEGSALADAVIFGARAGLSAAIWAKKVQMEVAEPSSDQIAEERNRFEELFKYGSVPASFIRHEIADIMWRMCGVVKDSDTMAKAYEELERLEDVISKIRADGIADLRETFEALSMFEVAKIIVKAALTRKESRGAYWRTDYKEPNNENWLVNLVVSLAEGKPRVKIKPVTMTKMKIPPDCVPRIGNHCSGYLIQ